MPAATSTTVPRDLQRAIDAHRRGASHLAAQGYRRFLARHPRNPQVLDLYAMVLRDLDRVDEAVEALQRALRLGPTDPARQETLVRLLLTQRRAEAMDAARRALEQSEPTVTLLVACAQTAVTVEADDEAVAWTRQALTIDPRCAQAMVLQAIALRRQERHVEALRLLEGATAVDDSIAVAHYEAGVLRYEFGETAEPLRRIYRAIELDPHNAAFHSGEAMVLNRLGRFHEALAAYDRARVLNPDDPLIESNQAWPLLGAGQFAEGWARYDRCFDIGGRTPNRRFDVPRWDGGAGAGRLLVWREQGIGDEIRCASMLPDALARVDDVVVECEPRLVSLFRRSFPQAEVRAQQLGAMADFDVHCPMHSLPAHVRPDVDSYRRQGPYLVPDPVRAEQLRGVVGRDGRLNVGISWRSMALATKRLSHYTVIEEWAPIFGIEGIRLWNLQYGGRDLLNAERAIAREQFGVDIEVIDGLDYTDDMESVAALIANLDVVVSVGTAVSCLAGALGVPVLLLCVDFDPFRFGQPDYPWFPSTEVIARHLEEAWDGVMQRAAQRLEGLDPRR